MGVLEIQEPTKALDNLHVPREQQKVLESAEVPLGLRLKPFSPNQPAPVDFKKNLGWGCFHIHLH